MLASKLFKNSLKHPLYAIIFLSILQIHEMLFNYTTKLPVFICFYLFLFYLPRKCERCERGFVTFVFFLIEYIDNRIVSVSAMPSPLKKIEVASPLYVSILLLFSFHLSGNKFLYTFMSVFGGSFAALLITSVIYSKVFIPCILHEQASE